MRNSIKNLLKKGNTLKSKNNLRKNSNTLKSRNNRQQKTAKGRRSINRKIRGGNPNLIYILYVLGNKTQTNQLQVIAMSKSVKNLHMFAMDLPDNLLYSNSESQDILQKNMLIDTMELDNSSSTHSWQTVSLPDIDKLIKSGVYDRKLEDISEILLHYTIDKSSKITGLVGAVYSNEVSESDGNMMTEFGNFSNALELLDNYEPLDIELEILIKENKLSIEKKKKEFNIRDIDLKTLSFDEYLNKTEKIYKDTLTPETWETEWRKDILTPLVYRAYDLNDILKKCNELNLWSSFNRSLNYYGIHRIIYDQSSVKKNPLFYYIEILRSYKLNEPVKELLNDNEFLLNQFKIDRITLKQFIDYYKDKNIKNYLKSLNYSIRDYKNRGISLRDIIRVTEPGKYSISPRELIELGFTLNDLVETNFFEFSRLKDAGFSIMELRKVGYTIKDYMNENLYLEDKDYTALIQAGYTAKEFLEYPHALLGSLKKYFTLKELRNAGCTIKYYMRGKHTDNIQDNDYPELIQAEYTADEFLKSGRASLSELKKYFTLEQLLQSKQFLLNYSMKDLKYHYSCEELSKIFKLDELVDVCSIVELSNAYEINDLIKRFSLEQLTTVYSLDQIFASGKYKYDDIKQFNKGDNKKLDNLLKECKKNMMRKTNLDCIYDPDKKIATNPTERYPK